MIQLLADVNIEGHVARLVSRMRGDYWRDIWDHLELRSLRFQDVGLTSLPVFTLSDADWIFHSKDYLERVTESLFDQLLRIETLRGTGRLFLP